MPRPCSSGWIRNKNRIHPVYDISPSAPVLKAAEPLREYISQGVCRSPSVYLSVFFSLSKTLLSPRAPTEQWECTAQQKGNHLSQSPQMKGPKRLSFGFPPSLFLLLSLFLFQHPVFPLLSDRNSLAGEEEGEKKRGPLARSARLQLGQLSHAVDQAALCVCGGDLSGDGGRSQDLEGERPWPQECLAPKLLL